MKVATADTWAIIRVEEDVIRKAIKQPTTWDSLSIKEIEVFSEIKK